MTPREHLTALLSQLTPGEQLYWADLTDGLEGKELGAAIVVVEKALESRGRIEKRVVA